jgi:fructokinase
MKIGIDVGGTKTEGILIDNSGKELARNRIKTEKNYDGTISGIISIVKEFERDFGDSDSVGIGMPGAVSSETALVKNANSIWLNGKPFKKDLEKKLNRRVNLANDANCFALSEAVDGAGKGYTGCFWSNNWNWNWWWNLCKSKSSCWKK